VGHFPCFSGRGEHAGENFQPQVLFILQPIRPALDDANLVVQPFDEAERHLVLRFAECGDPIPMTPDHFRKLLVWLQPLPFEAGLPVLEKLAGECSLYRINGSAAPPGLLRRPAETGDGESADMLLEGQRMLPKKMTAAHFRLAFPTLEEALCDLV
jgi:hypothetical protein